MYRAMEEAADTFLVEVSGWDSSDRFFVEHAVLSWRRDETKEVALRNVVRQSDTVFVRLIQRVEGPENFPVACRVTKVSEREADGRVLVEVEELRPRAPFREGIGAGNEAGDTSAVSQPSQGTSPATTQQSKTGGGVFSIPL